jgi:hypothetical protein
MSFDENTFEEVEGEFVVSTDKAILISIEGDEQWIPKSVVDSYFYFNNGGERVDNLDDIEDAKGCSITLDVATWFCNSEGLI